MVLQFTVPSPGIGAVAVLLSAVFLSLSTCQGGGRLSSGKEIVRIHCRRRAHLLSLCFIYIRQHFSLPPLNAIKCFIKVLWCATFKWHPRRDTLTETQAAEQNPFIDAQLLTGLYKRWMFLQAASTGDLQISSCLKAGCTCSITACSLPT